MKILCAVDDSEFSRQAVQGIGTLFRSIVKEILLLHVVDSHFVRKGKKATGTEKRSFSGLSRKLEQESKNLLHGFAERLNLSLGLGGTGSSSSIKPLLAKGHVSDTIIQWSEKAGTDCLVLGSRGLTDVQGYLLGSVSRKVVTHAPCSVLMVKGPLSVPIPTVLALDGSKSAKLGAKIVQAWLNPEEISLCLVSVIPDRLTDLAPKLLEKRQIKSLMKPIRQRALEHLKEYRGKFLTAGFQVTTECLEGNPPLEIIRTAEQHHSQLVCMGSKGLSGVERFTMGSVSEWVSTYVPSSVLVVRR